MYELRSSEFFDERPPAATTPPEADVRPIELQPGLTVSLVSFQGQGPVQALVHNDHPRLHFSCLFRGAVEVEFGARGLRLDSGTVLTTYAPGEKFRLTLPGATRNIEAMVTPDTLSALAGEEYDRIGDDIERGFCFHRHNNNRCARDAGIRLARMLEGEPAPHLLLHAATLEFLAWHLDGYRSDRNETIPLRDRKLLTAARERLLRDLANPPTIAELARETGLNQLKLKRGFKAMFGHSIYALFQRERMDRARVLLRDHGVTETAMILGYSNVSHFSAAFRKQFGVLPREARRGALD